MKFAEQLAHRHEKKIELSYLGIELDTLSSSLREALNSIVNQFIRNALVHGVENPAERKLRGKSEAAHISGLYPALDILTSMYRFENRRRDNQERGTLYAMNYHRRLYELLQLADRL